MKRALATVASIATLISLSSPVFASPNFETRNSQPRLDARAVKSAARAAYTSRHNRAYTRARYNALVQRMMPSLLAVTGTETNTDLMKVSRPGTRMIDNMVLSSHCEKGARKCGGDNN